MAESPRHRHRSAGRLLAAGLAAAPWRSEEQWLDPSGGPESFRLAVAALAAATDENVEDAALPFDKRRHGMIVGMGGVAIVVESGDSARDRGINPICEVLAGVTANSAFHGSRLDVDHICQVMEELVADAERRWGISRADIARSGVFVSHETYTPARGGSAAAEVMAAPEHKR